MDTAVPNLARAAPTLMLPCECSAFCWESQRFNFWFTLPATVRPLAWHAGMKELNGPMSWGTVFDTNSQLAQLSCTPAS